MIERLKELIKYPINLQAEKRQRIAAHEQGHEYQIQGDIYTQDLAKLTLDRLKKKS